MSSLSFCLFLKCAFNATVEILMSHRVKEVAPTGWGGQRGRTDGHGLPLGDFFFNFAEDP